MGYRNKTYVAFASEDIKKYWLMEAWRENERIDFSFFDAHDLFKARDTSKDETIRRRLRERMGNAKQVVLLGTPTAKKKGGDGRSFLDHEVALVLELNLPVVVSNIDGSRKVVNANIPKPMLDANHYMACVSYQPAIIKYALDNYVDEFKTGKKSGAQTYNESVYMKLGL